MTSRRGARRRKDEAFDLSEERTHISPPAVAALKRVLGHEALAGDKLRALNELCVPAEEDIPEGGSGARRRRFAAISRAASALLAHFDAMRRDTSLAYDIGANLDPEAPYSRGSLLTDPDGDSYLRRGRRVLDELWTGLSALRRTTRANARPSSGRSRPADLPRLVAVLGIAFWFRRHLGRPIAASRGGAFARTLKIVLPCLGYEAPADMTPVIRSAQRHWKFRTAPGRREAG